MRCEDVRPLIPELAEGGPRPVGPVEVHLSTCALCGGELAAYRDLLVALGGLREVTVAPPEGFADRVLAAAATGARRGEVIELQAVGIPELQAEALRELQRQGFLSRVVTNEHVQHAALSLGGAVVGATAIGLLWWRATRRSLARGI